MSAGGGKYDEYEMKPISTSESSSGNGDTPSSYKKYDVEGAQEAEYDPLDPENFTRDIVPQTDDPNIPAFTLRVLILGSLWNIFLSIASAYFAFRTQPIGVSSLMATLLSYPMGVFMAHVLPKGKILNPGPFSIKEHVLITILASAGNGIPYGLDNVITQKYHKFMANPHITFLESFLWVLSTQFLGFGLAGLMRRFLVRPASMLWPSQLGYVALFVGFHDNKKETGRHRMSRFKFFWVAFAGLFVAAWIPQLFMPAVTVISVLCFIPGTSKMFKFLASNDGLGIGSLTLDWQVINSGPIVYPFWSSINMFVSAIAWNWIIVPYLFLNNAFGMDQQLKVPGKFSGDGTPLIALNTGGLFDRNGDNIPASAFYNKTTYDLDEAKFEAAAPIRITTMFAMNYMSSFMAITCAIMHVWLWYGKSLSTQFRNALRQIKDNSQDIHNQLMDAYDDIPEWGYLAFLGGVFLLQILVSLTTSFSMPIWAVFLCIFIAMASLLPIGLILAVSGQPLAINVLTEFVIGLLIPGKTIAVMAFKSLGTNSVMQALILLGDLKLGHYMKISPVAMIAAQLFGTLLGSFMNTVTAFVVMDRMDNMLMTEEYPAWNCRDFRIFYSAGAIWGAIGPQRFFGIGSIYQGCLLGFAFGIVLPVIPYLLNKAYPSKFWQLINVPILASFQVGPGSYLSGTLVAFGVAWLFQSYILKRDHEWWTKYTYVFGVAVDSSVGIVALIIGLMQFFEAGDLAPYWGNPVGKLDYYCHGKTYLSK